TRTLPRVIVLYIFSFLDPRSLCRSGEVGVFQTKLLTWLVLRSDFLCLSIYYMYNI
ncbi:F-box-like domain-containing protein, partial [Acinetobacter baumannii]|uniref:F-box-like domain-containing protein n=1 Tax=Acinetobacter baumannii TaxID=470 RepID=UPI003D323D3F